LKHKESTMAFRVKCLALLLAWASPCAGLLARTGQSQRLCINPIRRVVTMLQSMAKKVEAEGEKEKVLFDKYMCYCKNNRASIEKQIEVSKDSIGQLVSNVEESGAAVKQAKADLKEAKANSADAKVTMAKAQSIRKKEAVEFSKASSEMKTNIAAMSKATKAVEKGLGAAFLQTQGASVLKELSIDMDISGTDREVLTNFLTTSNGDGDTDYAPQSSEIVGILKQMQETTEKTLVDATKDEKGAIVDFNELEAAKMREINVLTKQIEIKTARIGELGVQLISQKEDREDTAKSLQEDTVFFTDLVKGCETKATEWDNIQKTRSAELVALAETVKVLNDDDATDLFKKTLPSPSLLQITTTSKEVKEHALTFIEKSRHTKHGDFRLNLISLAIKGKKVNFGSVNGMVDNMIKLLKKEQQDDSDKKEHCKLMIDKTEDAVRGLKLSVSDVQKAIANSKESIAATAEEIKALAEGIQALDKQVADATQQRKEAHADSVEVLSTNNAAKQLLGIAKNRLNKFYNPKLYKAAPKRRLTEEEQIFTAHGGELEPTAAPGGIAGTGVVALNQYLSFAQLSRSSQPESPKSYRKKGQESMGVIQMLDMLSNKLDKENAATSHEEKHAQKEYQEFMKDSAGKRASDAKSVSDKSGAKAELEATLLKHREVKKKTQRLKMMKHKFLIEVHGDCDWLLKEYDTRKKARASEVEALSRARAVLGGADYE